MHPIVDGLETEYGAAVNFVRLDAGASGETAFAASGLPGHPGYVLLGPEGNERWRSFGQIPAADIIAAFESVLSP